MNILFNTEYVVFFTDIWNRTIYLSCTSTARHMGITVNGVQLTTCKCPWCPTQSTRPAKTWGSTTTIYPQAPSCMTACTWIRGSVVTRPDRNFRHTRTNIFLMRHGKWRHRARWTYGRGRRAHDAVSRERRARPAPSRVTPRSHHIRPRPGIPWWDSISPLSDQSWIYIECIKEKHSLSVYFKNCHYIHSDDFACDSIFVRKSDDNNLLYIQTI